MLQALQFSHIFVSKIVNELHKNHPGCEYFDNTIYHFYMKITCNRLLIWLGIIDERLNGL